MKNYIPFIYLWNEKGAALVIALMMLVICTIIGTAALMTTQIEEQISGNQRTSKVAFYNSLKSAY